MSETLCLLHGKGWYLFLQVGKAEGVGAFFELLVLLTPCNVSRETMEEFVNEQALRLVEGLMIQAGIPAWVLEHPKIQLAFRLAWHLSSENIGIFSTLASKVIEGIIGMGREYWERLSNQVTMLRIVEEMKRRGMEKEIGEVIDGNL